MINETSVSYFEALSFFYDSKTKSLMCVCGNTYFDEDEAEMHWFEEHNPW